MNMTTKNACALVPLAVSALVRGEQRPLETRSPERNGGSVAARRLKPGRRIAVVGFVLCCAGIFAVPSFGQRGWPVIAEGTVVSDRGTLLRGPRWSTDITGTIPTRAKVELLRSRGFNALHVYAEAAVCAYEAGDFLPKIQTLRDYTRDAGLYLVITIGNAGPGISLCPFWEGHDSSPTGEVFDLDFAIPFWTQYGQAFKNDPHVIFEIWNEPYFCCGAGGTGHPAPSGTRELQRTIYKLLRGIAPNNHILLFSYVTFRNASEVLQDVAWLDQAASIDWTKTAIAFHMYADLTSETRATIETVAAQFPVVQTEMWIDGCPGAPCVQNANRTSMHEVTRTSWLTFLDIQNLDTTAEFNASLRGPLDQGGVVWVADFGSWPAASHPPVGSLIRFHNGDFVQADLSESASSPPLIANSTMETLATEFEVISAGGTDVYLKASINDKYVNRATNNRIRANSSLPVAFEWLDRADGKVALRARSNNRFVSADRNIGSRLVADREKGGLPWEGFALTVLGPAVPQDLCPTFGAVGDQPVVGDWDGDGIDQIGTFRDGDWRLDADNDGRFDPAVDPLYGFGLPADVAVAGDWNGDGRDEIGVYRPSSGTWYLDANGNGRWDGGLLDRVYGFGTSSHLPVVGDWDGDGRDAIGLWSAAAWFLDNGDGIWGGCGVERCFTFGATQDLPAPGSWNGGLQDAAGIFRNGAWNLDLNGNEVWDQGIDLVYGFGLAGDLPIPGDWNGDGRDEIGIYRPSNAVWSLDLTGDGAWSGCQAAPLP